jgi:DNA-binding NarL/FixJ family response regulator
MRFKEFLEKGLPRPQYSPVEIAAMYFQSPRLSTEEICDKTGLTRRKLYDIVHQYGQPNRTMTNHHTVLNLANQGLSIEEIARTTHYTPRNVRYILRNRFSENAD